MILEQDFNIELYLYKKNTYAYEKKIYLPLIKCDIRLINGVIKNTKNSKLYEYSNHKIKYWSIFI